MANLSSDYGREARSASRSCGTCSLCCSVLRVDELRKRAGDDCVHQCGEKGCGIYETRPEICRSYHCLWRQGGLEEDERPDVTGGIVDLEAVGIGVRLGIRVRHRGDFEASPALQKIAARYRGEMPVRITDSEDVMNPDRPFQVLLAEGMEQRVAGERVELFRDGVLIEEKILPWLDRMIRRVSIWWRSRNLQ